MDEEIVIPLTLFLSIAAAVIAGLYFSYKTRQSGYQTLQKAIENKVEMSAELAKSIRLPTRPKHADLRRGVILFGLAGGLVVMGWTSARFAYEAFWGMLGVAALPGLIGLAYILLHFVTPQDE